MDVHTFGRRRIWIYTHLDVDTFYASDISSNQAPGHYTFCNTLALHCNTLALHGNTLALHCNTLALHCNTLALHCNTLALHCNTLALHCNTLHARTSPQISTWSLHLQYLLCNLYYISTEAVRLPFLFPFSMIYQ